MENCLGDEVTVVLFGRLGQTEWDRLTEYELLDKVKDVFVKKRNRMVIGSSLGVLSKDQISRFSNM